MKTLDSTKTPRGLTPSIERIGAIDDLLNSTPGQYDLPPGFEPFPDTTYSIKRDALPETLLYGPSQIGHAPFYQVVINSGRR